MELTFFGQEYINANDVMAFPFHLICLNLIKMFRWFNQFDRF